MAQAQLPKNNHADDDKLSTVASLIATAYGGPAAGMGVKAALTPGNSNVQAVGGESKLSQMQTQLPQAGSPVEPTPGTSPLQRRMDAQQQDPQAMLDQGQAALASQSESVQRDLGPVFEEAQRKARAQQMGSIA